MQPRSKGRDLLQTAQTIGDTGLWLGKWFTRVASSSFTGVCSVCNNLQPNGHEDTLGRTPNSLGHLVRAGRKPRTDLVMNKALSIANIKAKDLLKCRDIDQKTGKPFRDCLYCRLLCDIFDAFFVDEYMSWVTDTKNGMHLDVELMIKTGAPLVIQCTGNFTYDPLLMHPRVDLEMYCEDVQGLSVPGAPTMGPTLPRVMNTLDPSCMQFAIDCIRQCETEHPGCAKQPTDFVPTRVLDLGESDGNIRLRESLPSSISWAALSHCWGTKRKPPMLRSANLAELKASVPIADLPPTFSNAVQVCRGLGVRHLWIDSLCIIQDDGADWEREAAAMGEVYQHASLVIVGASSPGPEVPFLGPRQEDWAPRVLDFETPHGAQLPITVRRRHILAAPLDQEQYDPPFTNHWATWKQDGPLYKRGWCFQESYLAPRALHFAPGSLIYHCQTHRRSQESLPPYTVTSLGSLGEVEDSTKWRMMVKLYTARQLGYPSDKLPAVAGIASKMPQARRSSYLAGLWSESLLVDLVWHVMPTSNRSQTQMAYPHDEQQAPSWSWASINHGVLWNQFDSFEPLAEVLESTCHVSQTSPYGSVAGGHIKLKARLKRCIITHNRHLGQHHAYCVKEDGTKTKPIWFMGDGMLVPTVSQDPALGKMVCRRYNKGINPHFNDFDGATAAFLCLGSTGRWHFDHVGIVVTFSESNPGCMERIGSINRVPKDWYDGGEETVVTLI